MFRRKLAEKLISAQNKSEITRLLRENEDSADEKLALRLKEICYESWTSEPTKAQRTAQILKILCELNPSKSIRAIYFWISGISKITKGKFVPAIENLDRSAATFRQIKNERDAANTQIPKLLALALIGKYEAAIETGKNALKIFEKFGDELSAGKIEKNLGNLAARQGDERTAEKYYLSARRRFLEIGDRTELTMSDNSLANTYAELNEFQKAEKFYAAALENARGAKMSVTEAEIEASLGNLARFRGKFAEALKLLELSRRKYEELKMPHQTAIAELEIADIYAELNLAQEAFEIYQRVADTLQKLKLQNEEARARANFGRVAPALGELKLARNQLKKSSRLYLSEKNKTGAAIVKLSEAKLEFSANNFQKSLKIIEEAEKLLAGSDYLRHKLNLQNLKGETLAKLGRFAEAEDLLEKTYAQSMRKNQPQLAQTALNSLGKIAFEGDDSERAEKYFKKAVKLIETLRAPLAAEEFRMAFLSDKLAPFENLAKIYLKQNKTEKAFLMIEQARSRSLAETLENGGVFDKNNVAPKLRQKLENVREELNWFYSRLNRADESEIEKLQAEAYKREKEIGELMRQIESTSERKFDQNKAFNLKNLRQNLGKKKVLLEFVSFEGEISAFVINDKNFEFFPALIDETEVISLLENLQFQFGALRYGVKIQEKFALELKKRADFYLQKLYEKLLAPLAQHFEARNPVIVPVGALNYVPFHALYNGEKYVIESREVVYSPSATVWNLANKKSSDNPKNALLIGFADEKIPLVNREIETLEKIFKTAKVLQEKDANFANYKLNAPKFDILHLACHGQFRAENPLFSSLHLADGFITVRDIFTQKLKAELVTLSACETGLNKIFAGDEILGLTRGFLSAGAKSLILSLWTVNDEATTILMTEFYTHLRQGNSIAKSLQKAQNYFIVQNSHPYFWSPFALIGK
ncbi:MAG: CHAT domain-containing protein [Pyrinomonadaceae bacterium]|nr:CHAT domain-containing protein [Pyrinomonadaceae bacterium]